MIGGTTGVNSHNYAENVIAAIELAVTGGSMEPQRLGLHDLLATAMEPAIDWREQAANGSNRGSGTGTTFWNVTKTTWPQWSPPAERGSMLA